MKKISEILETNRIEGLKRGLLNDLYPLQYRGYKITHNATGWPYGHVYAFLHEDYDGALDAKDHRLGTGKTIEECIIAINNQIEEL